MTSLSINLNKVALLRNQRDVGYPSVVEAARTVVAAGANGITVHPRPDQRHIRFTDVHDIAALLRAPGHAAIEYNIEGNPFHGMLPLLEAARPHQATLVPDAPDAPTSNAGWRLPDESPRIAPLIARIKALGIRVSLFVDPDIAVVRAARDAGADRVELYTEAYAKAFGTARQAEILDRYARAAAAALDCGLGVNAGHDLTMANLPALRAAIPHLLEVSIGHAFTSDALWLGFDAAVRGYLAALAPRAAAG